MPSKNLPTPKTQKQITRGLINPYDKLDRGNPNPNPPDKLNRGKKVSFIGDETKPFLIGIKDIDESILFYFENVIRPSVIQNGQRIAVPIIYGAPERWKSMQRDGFIRDQKGKLMAPLIMFKRTKISRNKDLYNKLDANYPNNIAYYQKAYSKQNAYDKFNILNNRQPVKQQYAVIVPDYVTLDYSCVIYTYYVEQLNKIVEAINYASNSYWGDKNRFKFKAIIDSFDSTTELESGNERSVRATFNITLNGYIIPDLIQKDLTLDKKKFTYAQTVIQTETIANIEDISNEQLNKPIDTRNSNNTIIAPKFNPGER